MNTQTLSDPEDEKIKEAVDELIDRGLAIRVTDSSGEPGLRITEAGKIALQELIDQGVLPPLP